jgi:DnaK suppressor protein
VKIERERTVGDDAGLSREQRDWLKKRLLAERDGIRRRLASRRGALVGTSERAADEGDLASDNADQGLIARLVDREAKLLREVEAALHRMAVGTYGVCTLSGEPIGLERLQARPWTRHALEAEEGAERRRAQRGSASQVVADGSLIPKDEVAA